MYKLAVMGDRDSIYGFGAVGLEVFPVTDKEKAGKLLMDLASKDYAVIYITEALAKDLESEISQFAQGYLPAIILIPGISGNTGDAMKSVRSLAARAIGSDFIFGNA